MVAWASCHTIGNQVACHSFRPGCHIVTKEHPRCRSSELEGTLVSGSMMSRRAQVLGNMFVDIRFGMESYLGLEVSILSPRTNG